MVDVSVSANGSRYFQLNKCSTNKEMHYIDEPHGVWSGMAKGNLGHQMRYTVSKLESQLKRKENPHVLQLDLDDESNPQHWILFADGRQVAHGTGEFARECFYERADAFLDLCRDAVETEGHLQQWSKKEYFLLKTAQKIARVELVAAKEEKK